MSSSNETLKQALSLVKTNAEKRGDLTEENVRMPVNIPVSYKNKLKVLAAVEDTTMRALILEAIDMLFETRQMK